MCLVGVTLLALFLTLVVLVFPKNNGTELYEQSVRKKEEVGRKFMVGGRDQLQVKEGRRVTQVMLCEGAIEEGGPSSLLTGLPTIELKEVVTIERE